jgi:uncharacterized protein YggT (Ycf19 family)
MANNKPSDSTLVFIKLSRGITYVVYAYTLIASIFLALAFVMQLFGANYATPFVKFIYEGAYGFLKPFRGIFPGQQVGDTSYFNSSALFAIMMYLIFAAALHSLITYITAKMVQHQQELDSTQK